MPPKQAPSAANGNYNLTQANLSMIRAALCCVDEFKPDFTKVTSDFGLSKGHGPRDFRAAIKPLGLDVKDGKVFVVNGNDAAAATNLATPTKAKGKGKRKSPPAGDAEGSDDVEDEPADDDKPAPSSNKKAKVATKAAPAVIKTEPKTEDNEADV